MTTLADVDFSLELVDAHSEMLFACLSVFLLTCPLHSGCRPVGTRTRDRVLTVFTGPSWIKQDAPVCALKSLASPPSA